MDKSIKLAVAGSGKTTYIINDLQEDDRAIVITYTVANHQNIINKVENKFGHVPDSIHIMTFFNFIYQFCYSPFLNEKIGAKGLTFEKPHWRTTFKKRSDLEYYLDKNNNLYHNRISKLILERVENEKLKKRLEKYYTKIYIDEVQDLGGHDFNLILNLLDAEIQVRLVGDFYQHTYSTSRDLNTNKNIHSDIDKFIEEFKSKNISVDRDNLKKSWRCSAEVCQFIRDNLSIDIYPKTAKFSQVSFIDDRDKIKEIFNNNEIVKLFFKNSDTYDCFSNNWGKSKGIDEYQDVCVVLYKKATSYYKKGKLNSLPTTSKNKLYVACSRPHNNLYLVSQNALDLIFST